MHARDPANLAAIERTAHSTHARAHARDDSARNPKRCDAPKPSVRVAKRPQMECLQQELKRMDGVARFRLVVA
jgi:hypothetical protein